jgi:hypothetical protein
MYFAQNFPHKKGYIHSIGLFLTWLATQISLRAVFGMRPTMTGRVFPNTPLEQLVNIDWPVFLFALFWIIPLARYRKLPQFLRISLILVCIPLLIANFLFGEFEEPRQFLDFAIFLIPATLIAIFGSKTQDNLSTENPLLLDQQPGPADKPADQAVNLQQTAESSQ